MAIHARGVIEAARDAHPTFTKQAQPDGPALRFIARYQQDLLARIAALKPDAVHATQELELPLTEPADGTPLEPYIYVHGTAAYYGGRDQGPQPVRIVDYPLRFERFTGPAAYIGGDKFFLLGSERGEWHGVERVVIDLFPGGPDVIKPDEDLLLPGQAQVPVVAALAAFFAERNPAAEPPPPVAQLVARAEAAEVVYLDAVSGRRRVKVSRAREVW